VPELLRYGGNIPLSTTRHSSLSPTILRAALELEMTPPKCSLGARDGRQRDYATLRWTVNRDFYARQGKHCAARMKAGKLRRSRGESGNGPGGQGE
jgi:hypothetical protein